MDHKAKIMELYDEKRTDLWEVGSFLWDIINDPSKDPTTKEWVKMANKVDEAYMYLGYIHKVYLV